MEKKILLIDFDGVIVNTFDVCMGVNTQLGLNLSQDEYRKQFEGNIYDKHDEDDEEVVSEDGEWFKLYIPRMLELKPVDGVIEVIDKLGKNYTLIIVSSSINSPIKKYLEKHDLLQQFDEVLGADIHKSKVRKIEMVFDKYKVSPEDCLFITDSLGDVREANKKRVKALGVTWGWHSRETLDKDSPFKVIDKPSEMITAVESYFGR
jgi:phosphoglycolate phosphatase